MSEESNAHLIEQLEKLGTAVRPWTPDDFICFAIVAREGLPPILASLRRSAPASTPAAHWREEGKPDPHGDLYGRERVLLCGGDMTDDEIANAVFLDPGIGNLTAAKERIRWLSRALEATRSAPASGEMGEAKFATQTYGAVVATIFEGNDVLVEVHKRQHSAELIIHNRRGETDRWDDCTADLKPEYFEMLGSVAKALRTPSGETGEETGS